MTSEAMKEKYPNDVVIAEAKNMVLSGLKNIGKYQIRQDDAEK